MSERQTKRGYKEHYEYAVGTFIQESSKLVGHVPIELSFLVFTFLRAHEDNQVVVEVTGSRKLENGLVIPGTFKAVTRSRRLGAKFYEERNKVKQLCADMDISIKEMRTKPERHHCLYYLTMSHFIKRTV